MSFDESFVAAPCDLHFHLNRTTFKLMHRALENCTRLFQQNAAPQTIATTPFSPLLPIKCNSEQNAAVSEIVGADGGRPIIIFGFVSFLISPLCRNLILFFDSPPGTGKTTTLVEALFQLLWKANTRVLVCAPSNFAVDHICQQIVRNWPFKDNTRERVFRMNGFLRNPKTVPPELKDIIHYKVSLLFSFSRCPKI